MNKQTNIVTVASYYGSGSSAVTDYVSEFDNVKSLTSYEFRFIQDPDGVAELEYNLVENFNRHNSGHALKRYKKLVDYYGKHLFVKRYENYFDNKWKEISLSIQAYGNMIFMIREHGMNFGISFRIVYYIRLFGKIKWISISFLIRE